MCSTCILASSFIWTIPSWTKTWRVLAVFPCFLYKCLLQTICSLQLPLCRSNYSMVHLTPFIFPARLFLVPFQLSSMNGMKRETVTEATATSLTPRRTTSIERVSVGQYYCAIYTAELHDSWRYRQCLPAADVVQSRYKNIPLLDSSDPMSNICSTDDILPVKMAEQNASTV